VVLVIESYLSGLGVINIEIMARLITEKMADAAHKLLETYYKQQEAYKRKNSLCLQCGKYIGHTATENEWCWCDECVNKAFDAGDDENGNPVY